MALGGNAQNLVPNPSFEVYDTCPQDASMLHYASPWFVPTWGTPDYYNSCFTYSNPWSSNMDVPTNIFGEQSAKTGVGYAGLYLAYPWTAGPPNYEQFREYIETELIDTLQTGVKYYVTFYLSLADSSQYSTDVAGIYFSNDTLKSDTSYRLHYIPHISNTNGNYLNNKLGWMKFSGTYVANGTEKFITIGNFLDNASTDTIPSSGGGTIFGSDFYAAYYYIDDVCVSSDSLTCNLTTGVIESQTNQTDYNIYPNPTTNQFRIDGTEPYNLTIYNSIGQVLMTEYNIKTSSKTIDITQYSKGVLFVRITTGDKSYTHKILVQ